MDANIIVKKVFLRIIMKRYKNFGLFYLIKQTNGNQLYLINRQYKLEN